jgi:hypothetical protein
MTLHLDIILDLQNEINSKAPPAQQKEEFYVLPLQAQLHDPSPQAFTAPNVIHTA